MPISSSLALPGLERLPTASGAGHVAKFLPFLVLFPSSLRLGADRGGGQI